MAFSAVMAFSPFMAGFCGQGKGLPAARFPGGPDGQKETIDTELKNRAA
jgi:hypothetical protein